MLPGRATRRRRANPRVQVRIPRGVERPQHLITCYPIGISQSSWKSVLHQGVIHVRTRASAVAVAVALLAASPALAADEKLQPYEATVTRAQAALVADSGIELDHAGLESDVFGEQKLELAITPTQAA